MIGTSECPLSDNPLIPALGREGIHEAGGKEHDLSGAKNNQLPVIQELEHQGASMSCHTTILRLCCVMVVILCAVLPAAVWAQGPATGEEKGDSATVEKAKADFGKLKGRWVRTDGGYILSVQDVDPGGKMDAAYYNPRPINVSKAQVTREGTTLKVFIELRDAGYPGSNYTLVYDPKTDRLGGVYYQAAVGQRFDVIFVRSK
jgi:hypothetical protein